MLTILYSVLVLTLIGILFSKEIHKHANTLYIVAIIIAIFTTTESPNIVNLGYVPIAIFIVVLFSGLLDKGTIRKRLFTIRAEYAILGSILLFPHAFGYFEYYLFELGISSITISFLIGIVAYLLMIPLFITSFQKIRRKMGYKNWKRLHRLAYVFFLAVGVHVILIANNNQLIYIAHFSFYFGLRLISAMQTKLTPKPKPKKVTN